MKKKHKIIGGLLATAIAITGVASLVGCGESGGTAELVDTYYSNTRMKVLAPEMGGSRAYYLVLETFSVSLYSDDTYVCQINITESLGSGATQDVSYRTIRNVNAFTRYGTYELTKDEDAGTFDLKLGKASRIIYALNGGHGQLDPGTGYSYVDSADAETIKDFNAQWEWYGDWENFSNLVGAETELDGALETHLCSENSVIFEYRTPNFALLPGAGNLW